MSKPRLLIATKNKGKLKEFRNFLSDLPIELVSLNDLGIEQDFEENGKTYTENSEGKARFYSKISGLPTLSDDGGIEIDFLDGKPGVYSNRWFGEGLTEEQKIEKIQKLSNEVSDDNRGAHFKTVVTIAFPEGAILQETGQIDGIISKKPFPKINKGYPYRSFFFLPELGKYYHESDLSEEEERLYNHRYKAVQKLKDQLSQKIVNRD
jgi:XTP/dITP diphosphohydrolase